MGLISGLLNLYILVIIIDTILSYIPKYQYKSWVLKVRALADFTQKPIRKILPRDIPFDISPLVVILAIKLIQMLW
ncbi:YggT family protein [bacterium]|nr:YggT family protein [bacterium]